MNDEESKVFMDNIFEDNKKMIENPNYVRDEWVKLSMSLENTYLSILNGNGRFMRKLNEKFSWLKLVYTNDRKLVIKNIVTCETHQEIVETILKKN